MQLLIILAILLYGTKSGGKDIINEARPLIENLGGAEAKEAFKNAESVLEVLSAVQELTGADIGELFRPEKPLIKLPQPSVAYEINEENQGDSETFTSTKNSINFPLAPVSQIADKDITYSLSRYISQN